MDCEYSNIMQKKVLLRCQTLCSCKRRVIWRGGDETTTRSRILFYKSLPAQAALRLQPHSLPSQGAELGINHITKDTSSLAIHRCLTWIPGVNRCETSEITLDDVGAPLLLLNVFRVCIQEGKKQTKEAFTHLPTCLEAFSKNFAFDATLQKRKKTFSTKSTSGT